MTLAPGRLCHACWQRTYEHGEVADGWCQFCGAYEDEQQGKAPPKLFRIRAADHAVLACNAAELGPHTEPRHRRVGYTTVQLGPTRELAVLETFFTCTDPLPKGDGVLRPFLTYLVSNQTSCWFDEFTRRYSSWRDAEEGHAMALRRILELNGLEGWP